MRGNVSARETRENNPVRCNFSATVSASAPCGNPDNLQNSSDLFCVRKHSHASTSNASNRSIWKLCHRLFDFVIISADGVRQWFLGEIPSTLCTCTECGNAQKFLRAKIQPNALLDLARQSLNSERGASASCAASIENRTPTKSTFLHLCCVESRLLQTS